MTATRPMRDTFADALRIYRQDLTHSIQYAQANPSTSNLSRYLTLLYIVHCYERDADATHRDGPLYQPQLPYDPRVGTHD